MSWRNRDWIWVVSILMAVIIVMISIFYANDDVIEVNFAIIASAVSIALALVAIFIALSQSRDNQELSTSLKVTMSIMNEKLNSVDEKVNKIDPDVIMKVYGQKMDDVIKEVEKSINNDSGISNKEIEQKYRDQFDNLQKEIEELLSEVVDMESNSAVHSKKISYRKGDVVNHSKWGDGKIIEVQNSGDATEITVDFSESVGIKRLLARYAPIKKVS